MKKITVLLALIVFASFSWLQAQTRQVTGTVTSAEDGMPLPGVQIVIKGTSTGGVTDGNGNFNLPVPQDANVLIFKYVGFSDQEVAIDGRSQINVELKADAIGLGEVVVVGYGVQRKEAKTGAVAVIKSSEIESVPVTSAEKLLQGKVAGVQISSGSGMPGSNTQIRIRGNSSINAGAQPLYVIDGVPVVSGDYNTATNSGNVMSNLNPNNIESMTVLKDAAAASIYGSRAANGVILITTKSGKAGKTKFNARAQYGFSAPTNDSDFRFMNPDELLTYMRDAVYNVGQDPDNPAGSYFFPRKLIGGELTNWWDEVFKTGITQNYEFSSSGGNEKTKYYVSGSYFDQEGIQIGSYMTRYNFRTNVDHKIGDKATIGTKLYGGYTETKDQAASLAYANPFWAASSLLPWHNPYNEDGTYNTNLPSNNHSNPLQNVALNEQLDKQYKAMGTIYLTYNILEDLQFKTLNSFDIITGRGNSYRHPDTPDGEQSQGAIYTDTYMNTTMTTSNTLSYNKTFADVHTISAVGGFEIQENNYILHHAEGAGTGSDLPFLSNTSKDKDVDYAQSTWAFVSLLGKVDYNYNDKYLLSASLRRDGSSRFGANNQHATFWSVGASWNLHREDFLSSLTMINMLKVRGSYGINGNASIGNYASYGLYGSRTYNGTGGMAPDQLANPDLTWEGNVAMNAGLDFAIYNRFDGSVELYQRTTTDMLLSVPLSRTTGFGSLIQNVGSLENKGVEFNLNAQILKGDLSWDAGFNFAYNQTQITDLAGQDEIGDGFWRRHRLNGNGFTEYYCFDWAGVNPATGAGLWYDEDGNITEDAANARRDFMGHAEPDYIGGFNTTVSYKGFSIGAYFNYTVGNSVYIMERRYLDSDGYNWGSLQSANLLPYWKEAGDVVPNPKPMVNNTSDSNAWGTSRFLEDGSFLRFKNLTVSYNVPSSWAKKIKVDNLRIYMNAVNLYAWHDVSYWDPERAVTGGGYATYPNPKTITFGIDLGF